MAAWPDGWETLCPTFGMRLHGVLRKRIDRLQGIVNGIDQDVWNPAADAYLPVPYDAKTLGNAKKNTPALLERFRLEPGNGPLFSAVSLFPYAGIKPTMTATSKRSER